GTRSLRQGRASLTRPRAWAASHTKKWRPRRNLQPASVDLRRPTVPRAFLGTPITRRARLRRVALSRRLSRFVIANHARAYRPWLRQIYEAPASPCRGFDGGSPLQGGRSP